MTNVHTHEQNSKHNSYLAVETKPEFEQLDRFITFTQAAQILGYATHISVNRLIKRNLLTLYFLPSSSKRILLSEVSTLMQATPKKEGKRGRPSKF